MLNINVTLYRSTVNHLRIRLVRSLSGRWWSAARHTASVAPDSNKLRRRQRSHRREPCSKSRSVLPTLQGRPRRAPGNAAAADTVKCSRYSGYTTCGRWSKQTRALCLYLTAVLLSVRCHSIFCKPFMPPGLHGVPAIKSGFFLKSRTSSGVARNL